MASFAGRACGPLLSRGTFKPIQTFSTVTLPSGMITADLNGDGTPDVVAASVTGPVQVILNLIPNPPVHRLITYFTYDNADETTSTSTYAADGMDLSAFASGITWASSSLRAYSTDSYDDQGREYEERQYSVDPTTGSVGADSLATESYYDHRGNLAATFTPGGQVTKNSYDGADRLASTFITDGGAVNNSDVQLTDWADATSVTNDVVLKQNDYKYDGAGNLVLT